MNYFGTVPKDIITLIAGYSTYKSIVSLSLTCKYLHNNIKLTFPKHDIVETYESIPIREHIKQCLLPADISNEYIVYYDHYIIRGPRLDWTDIDYLVTWKDDKYIVRIYTDYNDGYLHSNRIYFTDEESKTLKNETLVNTLTETIKYSKEYMNEEAFHRLTVFAQELIIISKYDLTLRAELPKYQYMSIDGQTFKFDSSIKEVQIHPQILESYFTILFILTDDMHYNPYRIIDDIMPQVYFEAKKGKQVYVLDLTGNQEHMKYRRDNIEFYQMNNLHVFGNREPEIINTRFDCIIFSAWSDLEGLLWNHPDVISLCNSYNEDNYLQTSKLDCKDFPNIIYQHISRYPHDTVELIDDTDVNMKLLRVVTYRNIPVNSASLYKELLALRNSKSFTHACDIIEVSPLWNDWKLLTDSDYNERLAFESYLNLWYGRGKEVAEKFVIDNLNKFTPSEQLWSPNKGWYGLELLTALSSLWK